MESLSHVYFYFLIFFVSALIINAALFKFALFVSKSLFKSEKNAEASESYAGGFHLLSSVTRHFSLRFTFVSLLFVLFNAEFLLLLPWALSLRLSEGLGFACAFVFMILWVVGYFYEYKKGALEWK